MENRTVSRSWRGYPPVSLLHSAPASWSTTSPVEAHETVEFGLQDPLLVTVRAKPFRGILKIDRRADTVASDALGAEIRHVGCPRDHAGERRYLVVLGNSGLDRLKRLRVE